MKMKRRKRTEILIQDDSNLAQDLASMILEKYECREVVMPQYGLTMIKMRESAKKSLFYMGEVLITEAKVEVQSCIGIGIIVGMEEKKARNMAIIDAAYQAGLPETESWEAELIEAEQRIIEKRLKHQADLSETKVDFETMDV